MPPAAQQHLIAAVIPGVSPLSRSQTAPQPRRRPRDDRRPHIVVVRAAPPSPQRRNHLLALGEDHWSTNSSPHFVAAILLLSLQAIPWSSSRRCSVCATTQPRSNTTSRGDFSACQCNAHAFQVPASQRLVQSRRARFQRQDGSRRPASCVCVHIPPAACIGRLHLVPTPRRSRCRVRASGRPRRHVVGSASCSAAWRVSPHLVVL